MTPRVAAPKRVLTWAVTGVTLCMTSLWLVAAVFNLERIGRGWDAVALKASADRVIRLGGGYYTAGADHKGPLWTGFYHAADLVAPGWNYWFVIAVFIVLVAAVTGAAVAAVASATTGERALTVAAGVLVVGHLLFGPQEYSRVLYSRNLTAALMAVSLAFACRAGLQGVSARALVTSGLAAGLAIQTMPTSALPAAVIGLATVFMASGGLAASWADRTRVALMWGVAVLFVVALAPAYYGLRGEFSDFWTHYWGYNRIYSEATGRSPIDVLHKGLLDFGGYYGRRPFLAAILVAFPLHSLAVWSDSSVKERVVALTLVAWWGAEALSVTLAQRFFDHYVVLTFVPVAAMAAVLAGRVGRAMRGRVRAAPAAALLCVPLIVGGPAFASGVTSAFAFRGEEAHREKREQSLPPERRFERAVVHALTEPDEYLLLWLRTTFPYDDFERPAATRYLESRWLIGEVYGATTDERYVLPGTGQRWQADIDRSKPPLVLVYDEVALDLRTPLGRLLTERYVKIGRSPTAQFFLAKERLAEGGPPVCASVPVERPLQGDVGVVVRGRTTSTFTLAGGHVASAVDGIEIARQPLAGAQGPIRIDVRSSSVVVWAGDQVVGAVPTVDPRGLSVTTGGGTVEHPVACRR